MTGTGPFPGDPTVPAPARLDLGLPMVCRSCLVSWRDRPDGRLCWSCGRPGSPEGSWVLDRMPAWEPPEPEPSP